MRKNSTLALISNIILVILCGIGLFLSIGENFPLLKYYTQDSNLLSGISSLLLVMYLLIKKNIEDVPMWVLVLRYVGTCSLMVTMIVVITVLIPSSFDNYLEGFKSFMLSGSMLFYHFICPVISFISFIFFEGDRRLNKKKTMYYPLIPTFLYALVFIILNILKIEDGPYPFLRIYNQPWYMSILWIVIIFVGNYLIARFTLLFNQMHAPRIKRVKE